MFYSREFFEVLEYISLYAQLDQDIRDSLGAVDDGAVERWLEVNSPYLYHGPAIEFDGENPVARMVDLLKACGITQAVIEGWCNLAGGVPSKWKKGTHRPDKYQWFSIAVSIGLPLELLDGFMRMAGFVADMLCIEDVLLCCALRRGLDRYETYCLLQKYGCCSAAKMYADLPMPKRDPRGG